ncbi:MAG: hypothetical protein V4692_01875 [Bdellovibrionota bacterium]
MNTVSESNDALESWSGIANYTRSISSDDIRAIAEAVCTEIKGESSTSLSNVRFVILSGTALPLALKASPLQFERALRLLILTAVESLGGANGNIRIGFRATAASLAISVEDNGRGLTPNYSRFDDVRKELETSDARLEIQARLGVGSRNTIHLQRVDATTSQFRTLSRPDDYRYRDPSSRLV